MVALLSAQKDSAEDLVEEKRERRVKAEERSRLEAYDLSIERSLFNQLSGRTFPESTNTTLFVDVLEHISDRRVDAFLLRSMCVLHADGDDAQGCSEGTACYTSEEPNTEL